MPSLGRLPDYYCRPRGLRFKPLHAQDLVDDRAGSVQLPECDVRLFLPCFAGGVCLCAAFRSTPDRKADRKLAKSDAKEKAERVFEE